MQVTTAGLKLRWRDSQLSPTPALCPITTPRLDPAGPESLLRATAAHSAPGSGCGPQHLLGGRETVNAESKKQRCRFPDNACTSMRAGGLGTEPAHNRVLLKAAEMQTHPTGKAMGRRSQVEVSQTRGLEGGGLVHRGVEARGLGVQGQRSPRCTPK